MPNIEIRILYEQFHLVQCDLNSNGEENHFFSEANKKASVSIAHNLTKIQIPQLKRIWWMTIKRVATIELILQMFSYQIRLQVFVGFCACHKQWMIGAFCSSTISIRITLSILIEWVFSLFLFDWKCSFIVIGFFSLSLSWNKSALILNAMYSFGSQNVHFNFDVTVIPFGFTFALRSVRWYENRGSNNKNANFFFHPYAQETHK